jgi:uncharacterized membrane protein YdcZ (DUF606 family)
MRRVLTWSFIVVGLAVMIVSYFFLTAPWGASDVENSNPRLIFAPGLFVIGVLILFSSALVYELLPDRHDG